MRSGKPTPFSGEMLGSLPDGLLEIIKQPPAPCIIINYVNKLQQNRGNGKMDQTDKSIHDSFNGQLNGQFAVNSKNTNQTNSVNDSRFDHEYASLMKDIVAITDKSKQDMAKLLAEQLKEAYKKKDKEKGSKIISVLKGTIATSASLASLAHLFGVM